MEIECPFPGLKTDGRPAVCVLRAAHVEGPAAGRACGAQVCAEESFARAERVWFLYGLPFLVDQFQDFFLILLELQGDEPFLAGSLELPVYTRASRQVVRFEHF